MMNKIEDTQERDPEERSPSQRGGSIVYSSGSPCFAHARKASVDISDFDLNTRVKIREQLHQVGKDEKFDVLLFTSNGIGEYPFYIVLHLLESKQYIKGFFHDQGNKQMWYTQAPGKRHTTVVKSIEDESYDQLVTEFPELSGTNKEEFESILDLQRKYLFPSFLTKRINNYNMFPKFLFQSDKFVFFEYFHDYEQATIEDFMSPITRLTYKITPGENPVKSFKPSVFFNDVISKLHNFYNSEKLDITDQDKFISKIYTGNQRRFLPPEYMCINLDNIAFHDFVVKRDATGKVVDWKYIDIGNFDIGLPRYIFGLGDQYPRSVPSNLTEPCVICGDDNHWYNLGRVDDID